MNFYDVLAAEKWGGGIPTINFFDLLFAQSISGEQWTVYEGTLPATLNANGTDLRQYQIYGADGGVGEEVDITGLSEPLCGIGTYTDSLDLSTGILTRRIKKLVLTGEENWLKNDTSPNNCLYYLSELTDKEQADCICTHFQQSSTTYPANNQISAKAMAKMIYIYLSKTIIDTMPSGNTKEGFKEYLAAQYAADTPVTVWYALAEPEVSTITVPSGLTGKIEGYLIQDGTPTPEAPIYPTANGVKQADDTYSIKYGYKLDMATEKPIIYGFHINPNDPNSYTAVTYLEDAVGKTPAAMGSTAFSYGDWANAFFMPRPCMLKYDGTVDYYLNPNDYSQKVDGTPSDYNNLAYGGNAMMEFPLIWYKFVQGAENGEGYFYCSNRKVDDSYKCFSNMDCDGNIIDHFYMPIYNGCTYDGKMRSISGITLASWSMAAYSASTTYAVGDKVNYNGRMWKCIAAIETAEAFDPEKWEQFAFNGNTTGTEEIAQAIANNTTEKTEWYIDQWCDRVLINGLLVLISKSIDTQGAFGRGIDTGSQAAKENYITGSLNDKGLFYGSTTNRNTAVKVFGMENWWALIWHRTAGLIGGTNNSYLYKLTASTADGSTASAYNTNGSGYLSTNGKPTSNNYVKQMKFGAWGWLPFKVDAYSTQYYKDYYYNGTGFAIVGGTSNGGAYCGAFYVSLATAASFRAWYIGAAPSCKPCRVGNLSKNLESATTTPIYIGDEPLWAVNKYADYTDYQKQKVVRAIKKYVLTGKESWEEITGAYASRTYFRYVFGTLNYCVRHVCISSHFTQTNITTATTTVGFDVFDSSIAGGEVLAIRPPGVQSTTLEDFKAWLAEQYAAGTPVTVWCALTVAEEADPPVPLPALPTCEGTTVIDYAGESVAPEKVLFEYAKGGN